MVMASTQFGATDLKVNHLVFRLGTDYDWGRGCMTIQLSGCGLPAPQPIGMDLLHREFGSCEMVRPERNLAPTQKEKQ